MVCGKSFTAIGHAWTGKDSLPVIVFVPWVKLHFDPNFCIGNAMVKIYQWFYNYQCLESAINLLEKAESKFCGLKEHSLKITRFYHVICKEIDW